MELIQDILVGGFSGAGIVYGLVELAKAVGLPSERARWLAGFLAVLVYLAYIFVQSNPEYAAYAEAVAMCVAIFLGATGTYKLLK